MMEKKRIGSNAGKVWRILNEKGEQSMFTLCHELGLTFEDVAIAIGWLAGKIKSCLEKKKECSMPVLRMLNLLLDKWRLTHI
jgi:hypothetical protein